MSNTQAEPSVRERIENALDCGPTSSKWAWNWREDASAPGSVFAMPHEGQAYAVFMCPRYGTETFPQNAEYAVATQPTNIRALLAEHDATTQSLRAEIERLRTTGEKLVKATNFRQATMTAADFDPGKNVFADETYWRAFDEFCDALSTQPTEKP